MDDYRPLEKYYRTYTWHLKQKYGARVIRISLDGGFSCPHRDPVTGVGGCIFCNNSSFSPISVSEKRTLPQQIEYVLSNLKKPEKYAGYIAYFQPFTNTYAPVKKLRSIYSSAISRPDCLGLAIGTRPDCTGDDVLDLLAEINEKHTVTLELGLQSVYNASLEWMNRGHTFETFTDSLYRAKERNLQVAAHIILGIPGETKKMMLDGARKISELPVDILKIHQLEIVRGTKLADLYEKQPFPVWDIEEYSDFITDYLRYIRDGILIQRLFSRVLYGEVIAPNWNRKTLIDKIMEKLESKNIRQGDCLTQ